MFWPNNEIMFTRDYKTYEKTNRALTKMYCQVNVSMPFVCTDWTPGYNQKGCIPTIPDNIKTMPDFKKLSKLKKKMRRHLDYNSDDEDYFIENLCEGGGLKWFAIIMNEHGRVYQTNASLIYSIIY